MADKSSSFNDLFSRKPAQPTPPPAEDDDTANLGPCCAAVARYRQVPALTVKHADRPWETFGYNHLALNCYYEPTRFQVEFRDADHRRRVVVTGRCLERVYNLCVQARLEWLRPVDPGKDFAADGETVVTSVDVFEVKVER